MMMTTMMMMTTTTLLKTTSSFLKLLQPPQWSPLRCPSLYPGSQPALAIDACSRRKKTTARSDLMQRSLRQVTRRHQHLLICAWHHVPHCNFTACGSSPGLFLPVSVLALQLPARGQRNSGCLSCTSANGSLLRARSPCTPCSLGTMHFHMPHVQNHRFAVAVCRFSIHLIAIFTTAAKWS